MNEFSFGFAGFDTNFIVEILLTVMLTQKQSL